MGRLRHGGNGRPAWKGIGSGRSDPDRPWLGLPRWEARRSRMDESALVVSSDVVNELLSLRYECRYRCDNNIYDDGDDDGATS